MFSRILVPTDGSDLSERALPLAAAIARKSGGSLAIATVIDTLDDSIPSASRPDETSQPDKTSQQETNSNLRSAQEYLERLSKRLSSSFLPSSADSEAGDPMAISHIVASGDPATELKTIIDTEEIDTLVIASRGRSGLVRGLLGSVTDRLISSCGVPVLVVRPDTAPQPNGEICLPGSIVVPLDGSELSEEALDYGAKLAEILSATLVLARFVRHPNTYTTDLAHGSDATRLVDMKEYEEEAHDYLDRISKRLALGGVASTCHVSEGDPRSQTVKLTESLGDAMIVMSSHGRAGVTRWVMGSVADGLIRTAPVPTMVIPSSKKASR